MYEFGLDEIEMIEAATVELHQMCLAVVDHVIQGGLWERVGIPEEAAGLISASWERKDPSLYGRFDLAFTGHGVKLLEYNADTPTSLLEASVIQWAWMKWYAGTQHDGFDQFNSIHEKLVARWTEFLPSMPFRNKKLHFTCMDDPEDGATLGYLMDTASQAGWTPSDLLVQDIGWHNKDQFLVDLEENRIHRLFKLYPWEALFEDFKGRLDLPSFKEMRWFEPPWKAILSSKGMLALLWELFPNHESLLETVPAAKGLDGDHVVKPFFSREGANVSIRAHGQVVETSGPYDGPAVAQRYVELPSYDGHRAVIGSWVVGDEAAGMGVRESDGLITDNTSRFVPHLIFG